MATLTWTQVQYWMNSNSHANATLKGYTSAKQSIEGDNEVIDEYGWAKTSVAPATPLSAILITQDTLYSSSTEAGRRSLLRDETTDLQEKAVLHLKGRAWPVRRTAEGIVATGMEEGRASAWTEIGWRAIATLRECQIVVFNEDKKTMAFFPEDIRAWSEEIETICVDHEARFVWSNGSNKVKIVKWIGDLETAGWTIDWPLADGTMDELKSAAEKAGISGKVIKDVLRKKIGRSQSIQHLSSWK